MHIIKKICIDNFRAFKNVSIPLDKDVIAIAGQNGAMKTTLLGLLAQPFSLENKEHPMYHAKTIEGTNFKSGLREKFKFSPTFDPIGSHKWTLEIVQDICPRKKFTSISIDRNSGKPYDIRFWSDDPSRKAGTGYVQCPVVFLSLKRLLPIGEVEKINNSQLELTPDEVAFYKENHNKILITQDPITDVHHLSGRDKSSLGPDTAYADSLTISAGQDNVGKIILAVLSFKKLQESFTNDYKGGMIFIDEIETTLYPAAQIKLLEFMFKQASKYKLQFFFTTHSETVLKFLKTSKYRAESSVVYLTKVANKIKAYTDLSWKAMESHLSVGFSEESANSTKKIKVYAEDKVAFDFLQKLLPPAIKKKVDFQRGISLGASQYKTLLEASIPEFLDNIILLDGDMRADRLFPEQYVSKHPNIVFLPGKSLPEKVVFDELKSLAEDDAFWDNTPGGYSKQRCFRDFLEVTSNKDNTKKWFSDQKEFAGRSYCKFFALYVQNNPTEAENFLSSFKTAYNTIAQRTGFDLLPSEKGDSQQTLLFECDDCPIAAITALRSNSEN